MSAAGRSGRELVLALEPEISAVVLAAQEWVIAKHLYGEIPYDSDDAVKRNRLSVKLQYAEIRLIEAIEVLSLFGGDGEMI